jgi:hypothetical protein
MTQLQQEFTILNAKRYLPKMAVVNQGAMLQHIPAD